MIAPRRPRQCRKEIAKRKQAAARKEKRCATIATSRPATTADDVSDQYAGTKSGRNPVRGSAATIRTVSPRHLRGISTAGRRSRAPALPRDRTLPPEQQGTARFSAGARRRRADAESKLTTQSPAPSQTASTVPKARRRPGDARIAQQDKCCAARLEHPEAERDGRGPPVQAEAANSSARERQCQQYRPRDKAATTSLESARTAPTAPPAGGRINPICACADSRPDPHLRATRVRSVHQSNQTEARSADASSAAHIWMVWP